MHVYPCKIHVHTVLMPMDLNCPSIVSISTIRTYILENTTALGERMQVLSGGSTLNLAVCQFSTCALIIGAGSAWRW